MKKNALFTILMVGLFSTLLYSQNNGSLKGRVFNINNNQPIPFANILVWGTNIGTVSDFEGNYIFTGLKPGFIEVRASSVGFKPYVSAEIRVTNASATNLDIGMPLSFY